MVAMTYVRMCSPILQSDCIKGTGKPFKPSQVDVLGNLIQGLKGFFYSNLGSSIFKLDDISVRACQIRVLVREERSEFGAPK